MNLKIGYARVSTFEQILDLQIDALRAFGVDELYTDKVSGMKEHRPNWDKVMEMAREGDMIVVWRLDRVGRGLRNLLDIMDQIEKKGVIFKTLTGFEVDTSTPTGRLMFRMAAAFIEYEREQIVERTKAGLAAARSRGKKGGRRPITTDDRRMQRFKALIEARTPDGKFMYEIDEIRGMMPINNKPMSRSTYFRLKNLVERSNGTNTETKGSTGPEVSGLANP